MSRADGCPPDDRLGAFASGLLPQGPGELVAAHLEGCGRCQDRLASLDTRTVSAVAALRRAVPPDCRWTEGTAALTAAAGPQPPLTVAAAGGPSAGQTEVGPLLRRRLRAVAVLTVVTLGAMALFQFARVGDEVTGGTAGPVGAVLAATGTLVALAALAYLWVRPAVSLARLRAVELALLATAVVYVGYFRVTALAAIPGTPFSGPDHRGLYVEHVTLLTNLAWYLVVVGYGLFIPNSGRRCLAVVVALAAAALGSLAVAGALVEPVRDRLPGLAAVTALGLTMTGSMAVFGSFRIDTLRREAAAARRLGQYRLVRKLGAGGMGEVHLAEHALLKRPCAVKLIRPDKARDPGLLERFEREVQATARLTHPNTVEVYDYGRADDGTFYYVMEYLNGPTLSDLVERGGPLPPGRAVRLLRQVCGALREAHGLGLVHRDIKPGNVIVCEHGGQPDVAKLLDFGLVRTGGPADAGLTGVGLVMGTPDYMAPEQALGLPADARTDLYSLGAVAYFLLAGRPPFRCATVLDTLHAHARLPVEPLGAVAPNVPADLAAVVMRCLEKDPGRRPPDAASLDADLARSLGGGGPG
ncbi:MAG: protein kinase [Gemmataceae bacterium]